MGRQGAWVGSLTLVFDWQGVHCSFFLILGANCSVFVFSAFMLTSSGVQISSAIVKPLVVSIPGLLTSLYIYHPLGKGEPHPSALFAHQVALWANNSLEVACTSQSPTPDTSVQRGGQDAVVGKKGIFPQYPLNIHANVTCYPSSFPHLHLWWVSWQGESVFSKTFPHTHSHSVVHSVLWHHLL